MDLKEFGLDSHEVDIKGIKLSYVEAGSGALTFLMVHGNPSSSFSFRYLMRELSNRFRCIALDLPGYGRSDKPIEEEFYALNNLIDIFKGFVLKLNLNDIVLVGHEIGGLISCGSAISDNKRFRGIVLINTITVPNEKFPLKIRRKYLNTSGINFKRAREFQQLIFSKGYTIADDESIAYHLNVNKDEKTTVALISVLNQIPTSKKHQNYSRVFTILSKLESWDIPTLLLYGSDSYLFSSKAGEILSTKMARPAYYTIEGGAYFLHEERWEEVLDYIIEWLTKL